MSIRIEEKRVSVKNEEIKISEKNEERRISEKRASKIQMIPSKQNNADVVWTLKNVTNDQKPSSKTNVCSGVSV